MSDLHSHTNPNLPDDDRDLLLARLLDGKRDQISDTEDLALLTIVDKYAAQIHKKQIVYHVDSHDLWERIDQQIESTPEIETSETKSFSATIFAFRKYAAVAALLLVSILLLYVAQQFRGDTTMELLSSASNANQEHVLADGSKILLRNNSYLYRNNVSGAYVVEGEAFFSVQKNQPSPFVVELNGASVQVLGTEFVIRNHKSVQSVFVQSGKVRFTVNQASVDLVKDEFAQKSGDEISTDSNRAKQATDWMNSALILEKTPLSELLAEIELHYGVQLSAKPHLLQETVSGEFELATLPKVLETLEIILNVRFQKTSATEYLLVELE